MPRVKIIIAISAIILVGFAIFVFKRNSINSELTQSCHGILAKEEFLKVCPNTANLSGFMLLPLASRFDGGYKCTLTIFDSGRFGIPIVVDVLNKKEDAWARLKTGSSSGYPQKRGDALGLKEPSILTDKYGIWWLTFVRDNIFVEMVRENPDMCSEGEFLDLGRLLYERITRLPGH